MKLSSTIRNLKYGESPIDGDGALVGEFAPPPKDDEEMRALVPPVPVTMGVHQWAFTAAVRLKKHTPDTRRIMAFIEREAETRGRRPLTQHELDDIERKVDVDWTPPPGWQPWPERDWPRIVAIARGGPGVEELKRQSLGNPTEPGELYPSSVVLQKLFGSANHDLLVCTGLERDRFTTRRLDLTWKIMHLYPFVVPNPMKSEYGTTMTGRKSKRCRDNVGPRKFIVVEHDFPEGPPAPERTRLDCCAALIWHLRQFRPLAMACWSGHKSLHAWFRVHDGESEQKVKKFFRYAVSLGADEATWKPEQLVRMPYATNEATGKRQEIVYWGMT